jgi:hypothetical protein
VYEVHRSYHTFEELRKTGQVVVHGGLEP